MTKRLYHMIFIVGVLLFSCPAFGLESDQYRIWKQGRDAVQDSTQAANVFLDQTLQQFLQEKARKKSSWQKPESCLEVSHGFMNFVRPNFFKDRLKTHLLKDLPKAAIPKKQSLLKDYKNSIFQGFVWPFLMPVAQTLKLNGVYLGTDKVDHFFASGQRYLNAYRRDLEHGKSMQEAVIRAIEYGVSWPEEAGFLGVWSAGSFSFADLEANFQGMQFGRDFCEGDDPILSFDLQKGWQQRREIRMQDYVSPLWDESFNNSHYMKSRWKKVKDNISAEYCDIAKKPEIQKLWDDYHKRLRAKPTPFHIDYLRGLMMMKEIPNPTPQSLNQICGFKKGVMQGPDAWQLPQIFLE